MVEDISGFSDVVVDTSVIASCLLPDESSDKFRESFLDSYASGRLNLWAPVLIDYEVANVLRSAVLRKRCNEAVAVELLDKFGEFQIKKCRSDPALVWRKAVEAKTSAYDAAFLVLAEDKGFPLLSLDKDLVEKRGMNFC